LRPRAFEPGTNSSNRIEYLFDNVNENLFTRQDEIEYFFDVANFALKSNKYSTIVPV